MEQKRVSLPYDWLHVCKEWEPRFWQAQRKHFLESLADFGMYDCEGIDDKRILNNLTLHQAIKAVAGIPWFHSPECKNCRPNMYRGTMLRELWIKERDSNENQITYFRPSAEELARELPTERTNERTTPRMNERTAARSRRGKKVFH